MPFNSARAIATSEGENLRNSSDPPAQQSPFSPEAAVEKATKKSGLWVAWSSILANFSPNKNPVPIQRSADSHFTWLSVTAIAIIVHDTVNRKSGLLWQQQHYRIRLLYKHTILKT